MHLPNPIKFNDCSFNDRQSKSYRQVFRQLLAEESSVCIGQISVGKMAKSLEMCSFHKFLVYSRQTWIQPLVSTWEWEQEDGLGTKDKKKGQ